MRPIAQALSGIAPGTALHRLLDCLLAQWPEHAPFVAKRFGSAYRGLDPVSERIANKIITIAGPALAGFCDDYRWFCRLVLEEELHFRRTGAYRLHEFASAQLEVYDNPEFMGRYTNGILVSQLLWVNHTGAFASYLDDFLAVNPAGYSHLEIGPGHGLLLSEAAVDARCTGATGWDVSASSLNSTALCLASLGVEGNVRLAQRDVFSLAGEFNRFDSVVLSEVIEHLEEPGRAVTIMASLVSPNGRAFIAAPLNSPAPDHIFLFKTPAEIADLVEAAGMTIERIGLFPATGYSLDRAEAEALTVTCTVIARRRAD
jgi:2-polyprenyl-3-methyl-5-hydroxy-6-metoxy-1,4-benzoquinol methylase